MTVSERFDPEWLIAAIREQGLALGSPLSWRGEADSTNADAIEAANAGAPHGAIFVADCQRQGRGRLGRSWVSPPGKNLYASLVLRPTMPVDRLPCVTLCVGLAVADAVARFVGSAPVGIKWPNDVLVRGRKVAGILAESAMAGSRCEFIVVGIGLNVMQRKFDSALESRATSLANESSRVPARHQVLLAVLGSATARLEAFEREGLDAMMTELQKRDVTAGRRVRIGEVTGIADGIAVDGRLRVWVGGSLQRFHAGEVEVLATDVREAGPAVAPKG